MIILYIKTFYLIVYRSCSVAMAMLIGSLLPRNHVYIYINVYGFGVF
jgi:hypothetical protein